MIGSSRAEACSGSALLWIIRPISGLSPTSGAVAAMSPIHLKHNRIEPAQLINQAEPGFLSLVLASYSQFVVCINRGVQRIGRKPGPTRPTLGLACALKSGLINKWIRLGLNGRKPKPTRFGLNMFYPLLNMNLSKKS